MKKIFPLFLIILGSCASTKFSNWDNGQPYKYYDENGNLKSQNGKLNDPIEVNVASILFNKPQKNESEYKTFFQLQPATQNELLKIIKNDNENKLLLNFLGTDLYKKKTVANEPTKILDLTDNLKIKLVFSNVKKYYNDSRLIDPNTRLAFLNTKIEFADESKDKFYFSSIDKIENEFDEIDFGKVTRDSESDFNAQAAANASADIISDKNITEIINKKIDSLSSSNKTIENKKNTTAKKGADASADYNLKEKIHEELNLNLKRLKTGFSLSSNSLTLTQQGSILRDISDLTTVELTLKANNNKNNHTYTETILIVNSFLENSELKKIEDIIFDKIILKYLPCNQNNDVLFNTDYEGAIRAVVQDHKSNNILEFDDNVSIYKIKNIAHKQVILKKEIFCNNVYKLIYGDENNGLPINISLRNGDSIPIKLLEGDAETFKSWLTKTIINYNYNKDISLLTTNKFEIIIGNDIVIIGNKPNKDFIKKIDFEKIITYQK